MNLDDGSGTGSQVNDKDHQIPLKFTGTFSKITLKIDPPQTVARRHQEVTGEG